MAREKELDKGPLREAIKYYRSKPIGRVNKSKEKYLKAVTEGLIIKQAAMLQKLHCDTTDEERDSYFIDAKYLLNKDGYDLYGKKIIEFGYGKKYDLGEKGITVYI